MLEVSFAAAFAGGVLSLLAPCSALLLPAFFAYAFTSRTELFGRTLLFLAGLCTVFVPLGLGASFVADDVPELVIAVEDGCEGRGVGSRLLDGLLARSGDRTIVLTARTTNPAIRLYERFGFERTAIITNRVGTPSVKMIRPGTPARSGRHPSGRVGPERQTGRDGTRAR